MIFRRVNETTINCIITEEDLAQNGIRIDDLFERKQSALEFIRDTIRQAAAQENFDLQGENTSMRLSVLPDHSVSLTITEDRSKSQTIRDAVAAAIRSVSESDSDIDAEPLGDTHLSEEEPVKAVDEYLFRFESMHDLIRCCRMVAGRSPVWSDFYRDDDNINYLIICRNPLSGSDFEKLVLGCSEFGTLLSDSASAIAHFREHATKVISRKAAESLTGI